MYKFSTGPQHLLSASAGLASTKEQLVSHLHVPVPGKKRTDTILLASLVAKF